MDNPATKPDAADGWERASEFIKRGQVFTKVVVDAEKIVADVLAVFKH